MHTNEEADMATTMTRWRPFADLGTLRSELRGPLSA